jgi:hypothetical protein
MPLARLKLPSSSRCTQLAWDFYTGSQESITGRLVYMRDDATKRLPAGGPNYRILNVERNYSSDIYIRIAGEMDLPYYTSSPAPGAHLVLDTAGNPVFQGSTPVAFTVLVPHILYTGAPPGRILQYGHGLFGSQGEVETEYLQDEANLHGYVLAATDWWGLCEDDEPAVVVMMATNISNFRIVPDRSSQGILNQLMLMKLMMGDFASDPVFSFNGKSVINTALRSYFGNSEGGILGGVYMAMSQDVLRGTLGVTGGPYSLLLPRSVDFQQLYVLLKARFDSPFDRIMLLHMMQMLWDRADPMGYVDAITTNTLPGTPKHTVLVHYGLGDCQVSYLGAYSEGRTIGCQMFLNNVLEGNETMFGFQHIAGPTQTSMIVGFDYGAPPVPPINVPPNKAFDSHEKPRRDKRAQDQMYQFFTTGVIVDTCNGQGCTKPPSDTLV